MKKSWKRSINLVCKLRWLLPSVLILTCGSSHTFANTNDAPAISNELQQSTKRIEGVVKDQHGEVLIGVSVSVVGSNTGTITDIDGKYSINVENENQKITFSYVGYKTQTVTADKTVLNITMAEDTQMIDEVVVVGYGVQKKENLTGAVSSVDLQKTVESRPVADIGRALQGSVPGLTITSRSGEIGSSPTIKIRGGVGSTTYDAGPLILVDNIEISDISLVNPDDIQSISVLKDAASASIYGARAAFGVVLITTKAKAKHESFKVTYSNNFAWRTPTKTPTQLPGWQQAEINLDGEKRAGNNYYKVLSMYVDDQTITKMKEWENMYGGQNLGLEMEEGRDFEYVDKQLKMYRTWDWYDMYIKDWMPQQTHNLGVNGGNGTTNYNVTFAYLDQEGLTKVNPDTYERYNAATSLNSQVFKWLNLRTNIMYTRTKHRKPFMYANDIYDHMYYLYRWQPMYPYGTLDNKPFRSALTELQQAHMTKRTTDYWRISAGATANITKDLTLDVDFMYISERTDNTKNGGTVEAINVFDEFTSTAGLLGSYGKYYDYGSAYDYAQEEGRNRRTLTTNVVATYQKSFGDHNLKVMAGANIESSKYKYISAKRKNLYDEYKPGLNLGYGDMEVDSRASEWAVAGFFGRVNYDYLGKYLLEVNGRYDGSSRFPIDDQFGFFPSFSVGYRITEEPFMQSVKPLLTDLKIRGSYGSIGNQNVASGAFISRLAAYPKDSWIINGKNSVSTGTPTIASPTLTWETVNTIDIGIDARLWDDRIGVTFDWYKRTTKDILAGQVLPQTLGGTSPKRNEGEFETPGWELAVNFNHKFENGLRLMLSAQVSDYKTKIKKWYGRQEATLPAYGSAGLGWYQNENSYYEGMTLGDIWGYKVDRLLQESDFVDGKAKEGLPDQSYIFNQFAATAGDVLYKDLNGDGKIDQGKSLSNDSGDKTVIGNMFPRYEYGFSIGAEWKGIDFNMFFQGVGKRHIWAGGNQILPGFTSGEPYYKGAEDYWTPENPNAFYPRPTIYGQGYKYSYEINDRYLLSMAYLRCKSLTIGYTLPKHIVKKAYLDNVRIYFSGENLFEFDNLKVDIDPETDIRYTTNAITGAISQQDSRNFGRSYPYQRTISFGLQVTF